LVANSPPQLTAGVFLLSYYVWLTDEPERFKQSITVLNIYGAMMAMACFNVASDLAMFTTSVVLLGFQVITKDDFLSGYGNSSVVTVGLLLVVAKGVEEVRTKENGGRATPATALLSTLA
jgi:hypothetical protein